MDDPTEIEQLILNSRENPPTGLRDEMLQSIQRSSRNQMRRDDFRTYVGGLMVLALIGLILLGTLTLHHSMLIQTILSAK